MSLLGVASQRWKLMLCEQPSRALGAGTNIKSAYFSNFPTKNSNWNSAISFKYRGRDGEKLQGVVSTVTAAATK